MKKSWILIIMSLLLVSLASGIIQTHVDEAPYSTNTNNNSFSLVFRMTTPDLCLRNYTLINGHTSTQACLFHLNNFTQLECAGISGDFVEFNCSNYELVQGEKYFVHTHKFGGSHSTKYKNPGSYWYTPTEAIDYLVWETGLSHGVGVFPITLGDTSNNSFWITGDSMGFENMSFFVPPPPPPTVSSISCATNLTTNGNYTQNPLFFGLNCVGNVIASVDNWEVKLYLNNTLNLTQNVSLNTSIFTLNLTYGDEQVGYNINLTVDHSNDNSNSTLQATNVFIDSVDPTLTVNSNVVNNSVLWYNIDKIDHNFTATDPNLFAINVSYIRLNDDGSFNLTMNNTLIQNIGSSSYTLTNYSGNRSFYLHDKDYFNGSYQIQVFAWDSHTNNKVRPISWDLTDPDTIKIEDIVLTGDIKEDKTEFWLDSDRYKFKITWENDLLIQELTISAVGDLTFIPGSDYKGHFVHFDSKRWIDFMSDNIKDVKVKDLGSNTYHLTIELYQASDEVEFESIGDLNEVSEFYYFTVKNPMTFVAKDVFTNASVQNFTINVYNESFSLIQTQTTTSSAVYFNITDGLNYYTNFTSPQFANNQTGLLNFTENGNFTYLVFASNSLYIFVYDEITDTLITDRNVSIDIINYDNNSITQKTNGGSLFYSGLSPGSYELRYYVSGYNTRSYYTEITDSSTQQLELFMLNSSEATYTAFIIEDETGNTLEGTTLQAYRHFIDCNCFKVVEMDKSTFNGIATVSLQQQEARYRFIVLGTDGSTIYSSTSQEGYKITDTAYTLTATLLGDTTESFFGTANLFTNLSWSNSSKSFYFTVNDPTSLVDQFCVYVNQYDISASTGKTQICSNCVNASTGIAVCNVSSYYSNGRELVAQGWIHTNTEFSEYWTDVIGIFTDLEAVQSLGTLGVFMGAILVLTGFFAGLVLAGLGGAIIVFDVVLIFVAMIKLIMISFPVLLGIIATSVFILLLTGDK